MLEAWKCPPASDPGGRSPAIGEPLARALDVLFDGFGRACGGATVLTIDETRHIDGSRLAAEATFKLGPPVVRLSTTGATLDGTVAALHRASSVSARSPTMVTIVGCIRPPCAASRYDPLRRHPAFERTFLLHAQGAAPRSRAPETGILQVQYPCTGEGQGEAREGPHSELQVDRGLWRVLGRRPDLPRWQERVGKDGDPSGPTATQPCRVAGARVRHHDGVPAQASA